MTLRQKFGRPLRLAVIGGGPDSWIGDYAECSYTVEGFGRQ